MALVKADTHMFTNTNHRLQVGATFTALALAGAAFQQPSHAQSPAAAATPAGPADPAQKFEVASVKRNVGGEPFVRIGIQPGGRYTAVNVPLRQLITMAYQLQGFQLVGGPDWINTDRFDITAKAETDITPTPMGVAGPMQMMVRSLLADRFKLVVHEEQREMPIYALVFARDDRRPGPALKPSTVDCEARMRMARGGTPPPAPAPGEPPVCGIRIGTGRIMAGGTPISMLPGILAPMVQRYVVDRTGLTGNYDYNVSYAPDPMRGGGAAPTSAAGVGAAPSPAPVPADPGGASIFTALQEQLGLKLESQRGPVKVLVIDSVQPPTED
jgi:uncharacterized protein (TIGR03435 family)